MVTLDNSDGRRRPVTLTHRDLAVLKFIAEKRAVPLDLLATVFFRTDPITGDVNGDPLRACKRRVQVLATAGYIWPTSFHDGARRREVATLGPTSAGLTGTRPGRNRVPPNKRAHHVRTLDALALLAAQLPERNCSVVRTRLEHDIRREKQRGRMTERGEKLGTFPDAAITVHIAERGRNDRTAELAVEYVTSKYTDEDIRKKHEAFAVAYDGVAWFADRAATAARVQKITGVACTTLK
jgi:hypothetical protein